MTRRLLIISDSSHKALLQEQRLLDKALNRISDKVWGGILSQEGEDSIRQSLVKTRSPFRAVLCLDAATLSPRWHVGRRRRLLPDGRQAIADRHLPAPPQLWPPSARRSRTLAALCALLHDLGKGTVAFQTKLRPPPKRSASTKSPTGQEPFRHEILSAHALLKAGPSPDWKDLLQTTANTLFRNTDPDGVKALQRDLNAPASAIFQAARIVAAHHHPLSLLLNDLLYETDGGAPVRLPARRSTDSIVAALPEGSVGAPWGDSKAAQQWRRRIQDALQKTLNAPPVTGAPDLFCHAALMLADRLSSSSPDGDLAEPDPKVRNVLAKSSLPGRPKDRRAQTLVAHLCQVANLAVAFHDLAAGSRHLGIPPEHLPPTLTDLPTDGSFAWQGQACAAARQFLRIGRPALMFVTAGTGSGKTRLAPALLAIQTPLVRITTLLPLRSLTTQTRTAYRRLGIPDHLLAIRIGGADSADIDDDGSEPAPDADALLQGFEEPNHPYDLAIRRTSLIQEQIQRLPTSLAELLAPRAECSSGDARLVAAPLLTATIDLMMGVPAGDRMPATAPLLRLADTDLIIDEIDLLSPEDQACVLRLVRACAAYGGRLCVVSATLPSETAAAIAAAYADGVRARTELGLLPDESIDILALDHHKSPWHQRLDATALLPDANGHLPEPLLPLKRHIDYATIERFSDPRRIVAQLPVTAAPFVPDQVRSALPDLLRHAHFLEDGRRISVGFLRLGTIRHAMDVAMALSQTPYLPDGSHIVVLSYHANLSPAARASVEAVLDDGLLRQPDQPPPIVRNPLLLPRLGQIPQGGTLVVLVVCTSIIETGRDHDYDWGIHETDSARSIIQAAGRIRRHRPDPLDPNLPPNLLLLERTLGPRPYAYPGPLTDPPTCIEIANPQQRDDLAGLPIPEALGLASRLPLPLDVKAIAQSPLAKAERDLRLAFLHSPVPGGPTPLFRARQTHLPVLQHLHYGIQEPTLWVARPPSPRRFRRPPPGTVEVDIWHEQGIWYARTRQCPKGHQTRLSEIISMPPGPALLDLGAQDDLLPKKEFPLSISLRPKQSPQERTRHGIEAFPLEGHPSLGWRVWKAP